MPLTRYSPLDDTHVKGAVRLTRHKYRLNRITERKKGGEELCDDKMSLRPFDEGGGRMEK